jgi:hypothetical protein
VKEAGKNKNCKNKTHLSCEYKKFSCIHSGIFLAMFHACFFPLRSIGYYAQSIVSTKRMNNIIAGV